MRILYYLSCEGIWGDSGAELALAHAQQEAGEEVIDGAPLVDSQPAYRRISELRRRFRAENPDVIDLHDRGLLLRPADVIAARLVRNVERLATVCPELRY